MGKPELGQKVTCSSCAVRFFDLLRSPAICPKCGAVQAIPRPRWSHSNRTPPANWQKRPLAAVAETPAELPAETEDEDADAIDPPDEVEDDDDIEIEVEPIRPADEV